MYSTNRYVKKGLGNLKHKGVKNSALKKFGLAAAFALSSMFTPVLATPTGLTLSASDVTTFTTSHGGTVIAPTLTINDPSSNTISGASIAIGANFTSSQDVLSYTSMHGITGSYNSSNGVLTLTGNGSAADYQDVLRTVTYRNTSASPSNMGARSISISLGAALYNQYNGHYYQVFNNGSAITWTTAKNNCAGMSYFGLQGYLVTVSDANENSFINSKISTNTWMGASDAASEGTWRWVTGPEGLEESGLGRHFSNQFKTGGCSANTAPGISGYYANWAAGEPNDCSPGEDVAHFYAGAGNWNDFPDNGGVSSYVVEFGGMPGDPSVNIQGSVTVNLQANHAPVVSSYSFGINEDQAVNVVSQVSNSLYSDQDGDAIGNVKIVTAPAHGTLSINGTALTSGSVFSANDLSLMIYTPALHYYGGDSFVWNATDGAVYAASNATMSINVIFVNYPPVLSDATLNGTEDQDLFIIPSLPSGTYSDVEGAPIGACLIMSLPAHGTLYAGGVPLAVGNTVASNDLATFKYVPDQHYSGADQFTWQAFDGTSFGNTATLNLSVAHVDYPPYDIALSNSTVSENQPAGTVVGDLDALAIEPASYAYIMTPGAGDTDNGSFAIVGNQLVTTTSFDYETRTSYSVRVKALSSNGTSLEKAYTITVQNVIETPTDIVMTNYSVDENQAAGTLVGGLASLQPEVNSTYTYALASGAGDNDNAMFSIVGNQVYTTQAFNYEATQQLSMRIKTTDNNNNSFEKAIVISVNNLNDAPTAITLSNSTFEDHQAVGTVVGDFSATDEDYIDTHSYALVSGAGSTDNASFSISGNHLVSAQVFDYNVQNVYSIRVQVQDQAGASYEKQFTINITHVSQGISNVSINVSSINENMPAQTLIGSFSSASVDPYETYTYELVQGAGSQDNGYFAISGNSLQSATMFDYESRNAYSIRVRSTNSHGLYFEKVFPVIIKNVNDAPTAVTLSVTNVAENLPANTAVGYLSTDDQDAGETFTYTLVSGTGSTDNASFHIQNNKLAINNPFDFETQASYSIRVRSTDAGGLFTEQAFTITVDDVNETPVAISLSSQQISENLPAGTAVGTIATTDEDHNDTHTYTLVSGAGDGSNSRFDIVGDQLVTVAPFDFEAARQYSVRLRTTDAGGLWFENSFIINVLDANDAPVAASMTYEVPMNGSTHMYTRNFSHSYTDQDGNTMTAIRIVSLPINGALTLNSVEVTMNQVISLADINKLAYAPAHNFIGTDEMQWEAFDGTDFSSTPGSVTFNVTSNRTIRGTLASSLNNGTVQPTVLLNTIGGGSNKDAGSDETTGLAETAAAPAEMMVNAYPNPFANSATINYELPVAGHVTVKVYDATGKEVKTLVDAEQAAGTYTTVWSGNGTDLTAVAVGQYIYMVSATDAKGNTTVKTGKLVKMK